MASTATTSKSGKRRWEREWRSRLRDAKALNSAGWGLPQDVVKLEADLLDSWQEAETLRLDLQDDEYSTTIRCLVELRCCLSTLATGPPAFTSDDLRGWVQILRKYLKQLQDCLGRLEDYGEHPEEAVLLATIVATAIRVVKNYFGHKSETVPWTEVEFLLAAFVRSSTRYRTETFVVVTPQRLCKHLALFGQGLEHVEKECSGDVDKLVTQSKKFQKSKSRDAFLVSLMQDGTANPQLQALHRDFALLRDLESLRIINEALVVALSAMKDEDQDWERRGRRALRRTLFVVGEHMKGSWMSPNLSARSAGFIEAFVHEGVLDSFTKIRDDLGHPKGQRAVPARPRGLEDNLSLVKRAVELQVAVVEMEFKVCFWESAAADRPDIRSKDRVKLGESVTTAHNIVATVRSELENIFKEASVPKEMYEPVLEAVDRSRAFTLMCFQKNVPAHRSLLEFVYHFHSAYKPREIEKMATNLLERLKAPLVLKLRASRLIRTCLKTTGELESTVRELSPPKRVESRASPVDVVQCVEDLKALREGYWENFDKACHFALKDILMTSAPREFRDHQTPVANITSPVLFGHNLRNFLHHEDMFIRECVRPLHAELIQHSRYPAPDSGLATWKSRPRWAGCCEAEQGYARLLGLARDKDTMFAAARAGDLAAVQRAARRVHVGARSPQGHSLAHAAAAAGQLVVLQWALREEPQQAEARDWSGLTPLDFAASAGVTEELTSTGTYQEQALVSAFHFASQDGRREVVRALLDAGVGVDALLCGLAVRDGSTALIRAALMGHDAVLELLLERGASPLREDAEGLTALEAAAYSGSEGCVRLLLDVERPSDGLCGSALVKAAERGHEAAFRLLFDELRPRPDLLLHKAALGGSVGILELVLAEQPGVLHGKDELGASALHWAAAYGWVDATRLLLKCGARRLARDHNGWMPVHFATCAGRASTLAVLLEGWDHEEPAGEAVLGSLLCEAAAISHVAVAEYLLDHGADVNNTANPKVGGSPPLVLAAGNGHAEMVKLLLSRGAQQDVRGELQTTPLIAAAELGGAAGVAAARALLAGLRHEEVLGLLGCEDSGGRTALNWALQTDSLSMFRFLLTTERDALIEARKAAKKGRGRGERHVPLAYRYVLLEAVALRCPDEVFSRLLDCLEDRDQLLRRATGLRREDVVGQAVSALGLAVSLGRGEVAGRLREWVRAAERSHGPMRERVDEATLDRELKAAITSGLAAAEQALARGEEGTNAIFAPPFVAVGWAELWGYRSVLKIVLANPIILKFNSLYM